MASKCRLERGEICIFLEIGHKPIADESFINFHEGVQEGDGFLIRRIACRFFLIFKERSHNCSLEILWDAFIEPKI